MMQEQDTTEWEAHNNLSHEALMGNADPDEAYDMKQQIYNSNCEKKPAKMAQQNAVIVTNQKNVQENGAVRTYIGREDIRRRGDRPQYSGSVNLVSATGGN